MRYVALVVQYDGSCYHGFQRQGRDDTVQARLEDCLSRIVKSKVGVAGAGRTDAGVHARGQVVSFPTASRMPVDRFVPAANRLLPRDIRVVRACEVPPAFHARYSALSKAYSYTFVVGRVQSPFLRGYSTLVLPPLDVGAMMAAATCLVGMHDFAGFAAAGGGTEPAAGMPASRATTRTVSRLEWYALPDAVARLVPCVARGGEGGGDGEPGTAAFAMVIEADGFLYHMVRNIVGSLLVVGKGERPPGWIAELLTGRDRRLAGATAPPGGLCLESVRYPGNYPPGPTPWYATARCLFVVS